MPSTNTRTVVLAGGLMLVATLGVRAEVPRLIPYQGLLTDSGGATLPGPVSLLIRLHSASSGGTLLFSETQNPVSLVDGVFSVNIGAATGGGVPDSALNATEVWLGVSVDGGAELAPRTRLGMVPYAAKGAAAERLVIPNTFTAAATVDASGNVGIGTTTPISTLHVTGSLHMAGAARDISVPAGENFQLGHFDGTVFTARMHISPTTGNVGIGTQGPTRRLEVEDPQAIMLVDSFNSTSGSVLELKNTTASPIHLGAINFLTGASTVGQIAYRGADNALTFNTNSAERMRLTSTGNLGIGTAAPTHPLHVYGAGRFRSNSSTNLLLSGSADDAFIDFIKDANTTPSARIMFNGFTNQTTHEGSIHFYTKLAADAGLLERLRLTSTGNLEVYENGGAQTFELRSNFGGTAGAWTQMRATDGTPGISLAARNASTGLGGLIDVHNDSGVTTVSISGDTGSGFGRVTTSVLQITGGSDLAEPFDVNGRGTEGASDQGAEAVDAGMVVSIDADRPGELRVCDTPYDRKVAGIISGAGGVRPGMLMGQRGTIADGTHHVALTGRVYCKCDASSGPIEPGDLLTTSSMPGHAMKVVDHPRAQGAVLGKAMTRLEAGQGLVLVLVQPQ